MTARPWLAAPAAPVAAVLLAGGPAGADPKAAGGAEGAPGAMRWTTPC